MGAKLLSSIIQAESFDMENHNCVHYNGPLRHCVLLWECMGGISGLVGGWVKEVVEMGGCHVSWT